MIEILPLDKLNADAKLITLGNGMFLTSNKNMLKKNFI